MATYTLVGKGKLVLQLSLAEARGLRILAGDGAEGILHDAAASQGFIGAHAAVAAARRAVNALDKGAAQLQAKASRISACGNLAGSARAGTTGRAPLRRQKEGRPKPP